MHRLHDYAMETLHVAVLGASGFTGGELLRLLEDHRGVLVTFAAAGASAGRTVAEVHPQLAGTTAGALTLGSPEDVPAVDLAFLALPHGESAGLAPRLLDGGTRVVDLAGDFRLPAAAYPPWYGFEHPAPAWLDKAVYGLTELAREAVAGADLVANPGCFPTPVLLGLAPLLAAGVLADGPIVVDGKTGVSGAGRSGGDVTSHAATEESVRPYRYPMHQHTPEMEHALAAFGGGIASTVSFVPHLVPAVRGVLTTAHVRVRDGVETGDLVAVLASAYAGEPFVRVLPAGGMVDTKRVRGSNVVELQAAADPRTGTAIVVGALDNLVKGAAGQAVQNLNVMARFEETTALPAVGVYP
jgi:N-acetyl-gamma-glutamyl-phosphate reductase